MKVNNKKTLKTLYDKENGKDCQGVVKLLEKNLCSNHFRLIFFIKIYMCIYQKSCGVLRNFFDIKRKIKR